MDFTVTGQRSSLSKQDVADRRGDVTPEPVATDAVSINGRAYLVKQALVEALGIDRLASNTSQARAILGRLGFELARRSG